MAENNESMSAIPEDISRKMEILDSYQGKDTLNNLSVRELKEVRSISESLVNDLKGHEGRFSPKMIEEYEYISNYCSLHLKRQGVDDAIIPDPEITLTPEYLDKKFEKKLRLFNSLAKDNPLLYNERDLPEGLLSNDGFSLLTVNIIEDLEKILKQRWKDQTFVPGDTFYEQTYKNVIEQAIEFSEGPNAPRYLQVFLGEVPRLTMIERAFSEDSADPARRIMGVNLGIDKLSDENTALGTRNINPETLIYHIRRNHTESKKPTLSDDIFDENGNPTARIAELKLLNEAIKEDPWLLPEEYKGELKDLIKKVEVYEEELEEHPEKKAAYDRVEELVRRQDIRFDNTDRNKELLEKSILERGYSPNNKLIWTPNSDCEENSIRMIAQWEKKFQEKLLELGAAEYRSLDKIKRRSLNKIDMTNSSFFTNSIVLKDEYDHPKTVLFNVSRATGAMEFTGNGLGAQESYEIAALNARKNNWKTVTLQYNGDPEKGVQFIKNSILALRDTGNYSLDDIRVPKKYANVLQKIREESFVISENPHPGTENDYVTGAENTVSNEQELKAANQRTGQSNEEDPNGGPGPGGGVNDSEAENAPRRASNNEEGGGGSGGSGGDAQEVPEEPVEKDNANENIPDSYSEEDEDLENNGFENGVDIKEKVEQSNQQSQDELVDSQLYIDEMELDNEHDVLGGDNFPKNDPPLTANERIGYRPVRGKKK